MTEKVIETVNGWYMENPKQKVELDDIVGLVKTDEPTDSVQLKKEAQLSICEKRLIELEKENEQLKSENETYKNMFFEIVETALTDTNCRELYCKGVLDIFDKANSLNQAREMIRRHLK